MKKNRYFCRVEKIERFLGRMIPWLVFILLLPLSLLYVAGRKLWAWFQPKRRS